MSTPLQTPTLKNRSSHKLPSVKGSPIVHLDPNIALQLETSLADQARSLLTQLQYSESLRKDLENRLNDLESQEKPEYKHKNPYDTQMTLLESQLSLVTEQNNCLEQELSKLKISNRQLQMKLRLMNDQLETIKASESSLIQECSELRAGMEREAMKHRQALKELQNENVNLSAWVSKHKQEKEQEKRQSIFGTPRPFKAFEQRKTLEERLNAVSPSVSRVKTLELGEQETVEVSEPMNVRLQESLELESFKASLLESQQEAEEWKLKYHQTKEAMHQLEEQLSEAKETIESLRETVEEKDTFIQEQSMLHPDTGFNSPASSILHRRHHSSYETPNMSPIKTNLDPSLTTKSKRNLMMEFSFAQERDHQTIETQTNFDPSTEVSRDPEANFFMDEHEEEDLLELPNFDSIYPKERDLELELAVLGSTSEPKQVHFEEGDADTVVHTNSNISSEKSSLCSESKNSLKKEYSALKGERIDETIEPEDLMYSFAALASKSQMNHHLSIHSEIYKEDHDSIEDLTHTMIGSWFQKFNRRGKKPQLRFFWINPYARTLNWSRKPQSHHGKGIQVKTVFIENILWKKPHNKVSKRYPPTLEDFITIQTPSRTIQMVPTSWKDYETWIAGLTMLLRRTSEEKEEEDPHLLDCELRQSLRRSLIKE